MYLFPCTSFSILLLCSGSIFLFSTRLLSVFWFCVFFLPYSCYCVLIPCSCFHVLLSVYLFLLLVLYCLFCVLLLCFFFTMFLLPCPHPCFCFHVLLPCSMYSFFFLCSAIVFWFCVLDFFFFLFSSGSVFLIFFFLFSCHGLRCHQVQSKGETLFYWCFWLSASFNKRRYYMKSIQTSSSFDKTTVFHSWLKIPFTFLELNECSIEKIILIIIRTPYYYF